MRGWIKDGMRIEVSRFSWIKMPYTSANSARARNRRKAVYNLIGEKRLSAIKVVNNKIIYS